MAKIDPDVPVGGDFPYSDYTRRELSELDDDVLLELGLRRATTAKAMSVERNERSINNIANGHFVVHGSYIGKAKKPRGNCPTPKEFSLEFGEMFVESIRGVYETSLNAEEAKTRFEAQKQIINLGMDMAKSDKWENLLGRKYSNKPKKQPEKKDDDDDENVVLISSKFKAN